MDVPTWELNDQNIAYHGGQLLDKISPADNAKSAGVFTINFFNHTAETIDSQNGFIWALAEYFDKHTGLIIRVDDIWLAALALLKPHICEVFHTRQTQKIPTFTRAQLKDTKEVVDCLTDMVKATFGDQVANLLLPRFSTTFQADSGAAALILLGTNCQPHHCRRFEKPREPNDRSPIFVSVRGDDWLKLQETFAKLRNHSRRMDDLIWRLSSFVDEMRRAGWQSNGTPSQLTADKRNPRP
ncbi:DUF4419 domain-containing protein [Fusarium phyllophilum]|uniref:DUF4419 domain-containing protein n=1 Tax=Fusarium phyllophilum TaxID=47803 RepID=A0A8H5JLY5_9HYPO|nr:DUF4419 domain-containing protein [Fusarium phyllophilum]